MKTPTRAAYKAFLQQQRGKQFYYAAEHPKHLSALSKEMRAIQKVKKRGFKSFKDDRSLIQIQDPNNKEGE